MGSLAAAIAAFAATIGGAVPASDAVDALTVRQLAGQTIVVGYPGPHTPATLRAAVRRGDVGGVVLFDRNIPSRTRLRRELAGLQAVERPLAAPLLTMLDQEGGLVARLDGAPSASAAAMGAAGAAHVQHEGEATARNLRSVGVNVDLAPVADLGPRGSFQQGRGRAFARLPSGVAPLVTAFAIGLQRGGVAATLKHFPGLGRATGNQDDAVQTVAVSARRLRAEDMAPFRRAVAAGARMVMVSSARYPALDGVPALLSRRIVTGELRERLGFSGVAITDDLDAVSLRAYGDPARLGVTAALAGNDLLVYAHSAEDGARAVDAIVAAERAGRIDREALEASVRRVLALRRSLAGAGR